MSGYYTILTDVGIAKMINATLANKKVDFKEMAVGDGGGNAYNPAQNATSLRNEVWRGNIHLVEQDENNPNWIVIEAAIPAVTGGFHVREIGIYDADGDLVAIGNTPETYKPRLDEGSTKDLYLINILEVSNASAVTLKVDPSAAIANRKYVDDKVRIVSTNLTSLRTDFNNHLEQNEYREFSGDLKSIDYNTKVFTGNAANRPIDAAFYVDVKVNPLLKDTHRTLIAKRSTNSDIYTLEMVNGVWGNWIKVLNIGDVVDNLTTNSAITPISARQAKLLQDNKLDKTNIAKGMVVITPTAQNTPTSKIVSWSLSGIPDISLTPTLSLPQTVATSYTNRSANGCTVWCNLTSQTMVDIYINYIAIV